MMKRKSIKFVVFVLFLGFTFQAVAQKDTSILVGVEYFNGWWELDKPHSKWAVHGPDWRAQYPERVPLLGEYNSQETMNKEINAASEHGVDFFAILYYHDKHATKNEKEDVPLLNAGLDHFMNSPNAHKMKFMIELTNHAPFALVTEEDWDNCMDVFVKAMKHPSYLRIDGRAVLKIHGGNQFYSDNDSNVKRSRSILKRLRKKAKDGGVGELLITVGAWHEKPIDEQHEFTKIKEIDGTMQYMDPTELPQIESDYAYEVLVDRAKTMREIRMHDALNYTPYLPVGWNPKPWNDPRAAFTMPTRSQWKKALEQMKSDLEKSSNLGFPKKDGTTQKAFTIYAWNEFGEGGFLAPTKGDKYMKLEVLKSVFGKN